MADWYSALKHIEGKLIELFPDFKVALHPGQFTEAELRAFPSRGTLVRVAVDDMPELKTYGNGEFSCTLKMSAVIVCCDGRDNERLQVLSSAVMKLTDHLYHQDWDQREIYETVRPNTVAAGNLYNDEQGTNRYGMWVVSWDQPVKQVK